MVKPKPSHWTQDINIFCPGTEFAIYDVVRQSGGGMPLRDEYAGETFTFKKIGRPPTLALHHGRSSTGSNAPSTALSSTAGPSTEHPQTSTGQPTPEYRVVMHIWSNYATIFSCTANPSETTFSDFKALAWNEKMNKKVGGGGGNDVQISIVDVLDDNGYPFLGFAVYCGNDNTRVGWAKTRLAFLEEEEMGSVGKEEEIEGYEGYTRLTNGERMRLRLWGDPSMTIDGKEIVIDEVKRETKRQKDGEGGTGGMGGKIGNKRTRSVGKEVVSEPDEGESTKKRKTKAEQGGRRWR